MLNREVGKLKEIKIGQKAEEIEEEKKDRIIKEASNIDSSWGKISLVKKLSSFMQSPFSKENSKSEDKYKVPKDEVFQEDVAPIFSTHEESVKKAECLVELITEALHRQL